MVAGAHKQRKYETLTVALLVLGYAGYYACRANLSVGRTSIIQEYADIGFTKETIGAITSVGTLLYALGKFFAGSLADSFGGKKMFLTGMVGAIVFTLLFALGGPAVFLFAWSSNRFLQSMGWAGMVKTTGRWFEQARYGTVMGVVSLSYLLGDFFSKLVMGLLLNSGWGWRQLFFLGASFLGLLFVATLLMLRESPKQVGLAEPPVGDTIVARRVFVGSKWSDRLAPLLRSPLFWAVCALSFGFTLMRETFNEWTPTYFEEAVGLKKGDSSLAASLFPLVGGLSVVVVGWWTDRLRRGGRATVIAGGLFLSAALLLCLRAIPGGTSPAMAITVVGLIAFVLIGPYSLLAGAISLDLGGPEAGSSASGWIDGIGYIGGILSGYGIAKIAGVAGWGGAWTTLAVVAGLSALGALVYRWLELSRVPGTSLTG